MISVIVPVYNAEKYLDRCIQSILGQTHKDLELLLVDDGSTDSSGSICDQYAMEDARVRVFHKVNGGASTARNLGLDEAKGEWVAFVDSDDWIDAEMYEEMLAAALQHSVDAVYCDMVMEDTDASRRLYYENRYSDHQLMYDCLAPINVVYLSMCNKLMSRKVIDKYHIRAVVGANMWEDVELAVRVRYFMSSAYILNKGYYHYDVSNTMSTTHNRMVARFEGQVQRVQQIEQFFRNEGEWKRYRHFVSLLKLHTKSDLWRCDKMKWVQTFNEAKWSLHKLTHIYSRRVLFQYVLMSFLGKFIIPIYRFIKK